MAASEPITVVGKVGRGGELVLSSLPFDEGATVLVTVQRSTTADEARAGVEARAILKGSILRYDDPLGPAVDESEWEALQ